MPEATFTPGRFEKNKFDAIRNSYDINVLLRRVWQKNFLTYSDVAHDATFVFKRRGMSRDSISRYATSFDDDKATIKPSRENLITPENVLWLCQRWGVVVKLEVHGLQGVFSPKTLIANADKFDVNNIYKK